MICMYVLILSGVLNREKTGLLPIGRRGISQFQNQYKKQSHTILKMCAETNVILSTST